MNNNNSQVGNLRTDVFSGHLLTHEAAFWTVGGEKPHMQTPQSEQLISFVLCLRQYVKTLQFIFL